MNNCYRIILTLLANIRRCWKELPVTNYQAYSASMSVTKKKVWKHRHEIISYLWALILHILCMKKGLVTSGVLSCFWTLAMAFGIMTFRYGWTLSKLKSAIEQLNGRRWYWIIWTVWTKSSVQCLVTFPHSKLTLRNVKRRSRLGSVFFLVASMKKALLSGLNRIYYWWYFGYTLLITILN